MTNKIETICSDTKESCLTRIKELRVLLDHIEKKVSRDEGILNDLGEIQGVAVILDCRLAGLAQLRRIRDMIAKEEE